MLANERTFLAYLRSSLTLFFPVVTSLLYLGSLADNLMGDEDTMENLLDFTGKSVLITGGSSGIGRATALAFAKAGAKVAICDISEEAAMETLGLLEQTGARAEFIKADVGRAEEVRKLVEKVVDVFGGLDCAFNNAGIFHPPMDLEELEEDAFDRVLAVEPWRPT